jgi:hypothetical protein
MIFTGGKMKKILIFLILLMAPFIVNADSYKVESHLIDSEIEIAGGLHIKELIVVTGDTDHITRTINNYSFDGGKWDGSVNLNNGTIYNSEKIVELHVSAYKTTGTIDFSSLSAGVNSYFSEQDPKNLKKTEVYTIKDNTGSSTINIFYPTKKGEKVAYYLDYVVSNVIVKHLDVKELNYTFKNLDMNTNQTILRLIIPYPTNDSKYHIWVHGNQKAKVNEVLDSNKQKLGIIGQFPKESKEINVRVTLPQDQVGIDVSLNKSNIKALNKIIAIEKDKKSNTIKSNKINKYMIYVLYGIGLIYILSSIVLFKYHNNLLFTFYILFGLFLYVFNYLFKYNSIYLYLAIIVPLVIKLITYLKDNNKPIKKGKKSLSKK